MNMYQKKYCSGMGIVNQVPQVLSPADSALTIAASVLL